MSDAGQVTLDEVRHVAQLANLELTTEELPRMQHDLNAVLGYIAQLNELDTAGVPAMAPGDVCAAKYQPRKRPSILTKNRLDIPHFTIASGAFA